MSNKKFILVVDDDPNIAFYFKEYFDQENYDFIITEKSLKAVQIAEQLSPDLMVIDLRMPRMNGFEVLERVRKKVPNVKVIIVSSYASDEQDMLSKTQYDALVTKPFKMSFLNETLLEVLGTTREELSAKTKISEDKKIDILYVDDEVELTEFLHTFFTEYGFGFDVANSGDEGIEKVRAKRYDLIISDLIMPGMTGVEMIKAMQGEGCQKPGMIAVLSVNFDDQSRADLGQLGVKDFLVKPLSLQDLCDWIENQADLLVKTR